MNQLLKEWSSQHLLKMEARSSSTGGCGSIGGGMHEHGEWEAVGGSQAKVLRVVGVRGLRIKNGKKLEFMGGGGT
jgi:hypothetical protein